MIQADEQVWPDMLAYLRDHHAPMCRQWFEEIEELGTSGGVLHLRASSDIHRNYLERQCTDPFDEAAQSITGRLLSVRFLGPADHTPAALSERQTEPKPSKPNGTKHANGATQPPAFREQRSQHLDQPTPAQNQTPSDQPPRTHDAEADQRSAHTDQHRPATAFPRPPHQSPSAASIESTEAFRASYRSAQDGAGYREKLIISPDNTFDNFVVGPENKMAHAAAQAVSTNPGTTYNPLFVHGGVGLSKSHLLQAVCLRLMEREPTPWIHYVSCEMFSSEFFEAVQAGKLGEFRHRFRDVDVLVIDDIHFLTKRDQTQEEFFHTFNALFQNGKQIVLSSDAPPEQIPDLEQRLVSRFNSGLVCEIMSPGYETRIQIVKNKARLRSIKVPDDAACYIAAKVDTNIREIEGAITKVHAHAMTDGVEIDENLARRALGGDAAPPRPELRITNIIDVVIDHFGVKLTDLLSKRKPKSISLPRQVCMYLAREHTRLSLQEIGGHFGGRDHTTVMHAHRVVGQKRLKDTDFDRLLDSLETRLDIPSAAQQRDRAGA
jgi:chromosomal replication initiator protein